MSGSGVSWSQVVPVAGQKVIEADPRIVDAFKNIGYSLPAAVADLVDNSVDEALAGFCKNIHVSIHIDGSRAQSRIRITSAPSQG